jgi:hypothetical protein
MVSSAVAMAWTQTACVVLTGTLINSLPMDTHVPLGVALCVAAATAVYLLIHRIILWAAIGTKTIRKSRGAAERGFALLVAAHLLLFAASLVNNTLFAHQLIHCTVPFVVRLILARVDRAGGKEGSSTAASDHFSAAFAIAAVGVAVLSKGMFASDTSMALAVVSAGFTLAIQLAAARRLASGAEAQAEGGAIFFVPGALFAIMVIACSVVWFFEPGAASLRNVGARWTLLNWTTLIGAAVFASCALAFSGGTCTLVTPLSVGAFFDIVATTLLFLVSFVTSRRQLDGYAAAAALLLFAAYCAAHIQHAPRVKLALGLALAMSLAFGFTANSVVQAHSASAVLSPVSTQSPAKTDGANADNKPPRRAARLMDATSANRSDTLLVIGYVAAGQYELEARHMLFASWAHVTRRSKPQVAKRRADLLFFTDPQAHLRIARCPKLTVDDHLADRFVRPPGDFNHSCGEVEHEFVAENPWAKYQYRFMYSLAFVADSRYHELFLRYDWVLRTDLDVFLTPRLMTFRPLRPIVVGEGLYCTIEKAQAALKDISKELGLTHHGVHNTGSTWFIRPQLMITAAPVINRAARHLLMHEFVPENEITKRGLRHAWPEWWRGVTSMYAAEIGLNAVMEDREDLFFGPQLLDVSAGSEERLGPALQLHTYHNDVRFSKFVFHKGGYDRLALSPETLNIETIRDYATFIALHESVQLASTEVDEQQQPAAGVATAALSTSILVVAPLGGSTDDERYARHMIYASWLYITSPAVRAAAGGPNSNRTVDLLFVTEKRSKVTIGTCTETPLDSALAASFAALNRTGGRFGACGFVRYHPSSRSGWSLDVDYSMFFRALNDDRVHQLLGDYGWILKLDTYSFVTPRLLTFVPPRHVTVVTGRGHYSSDPAHAMLRDISREFGLRHVGLRGMGSTWLIRSTTLIAVSEITVTLADHLLRHEFGPPESTTKRGVVNRWPDWWRGVAILYAAEQALNALLESPRQLMFVPQYVDTPTDAEASIHEILVLHTVAQGDHNNRFARGPFLRGEYRKEELKVESLNLNISKDYATFIAVHQPVDASSQAATELAAIVTDDTLLVAAYLPHGEKYAKEARFMLYASWNHVTATVSAARARRRMDLLIFADPVANFALSKCRKVAVDEKVADRFVRAPGDYDHNCGIIDHQFPLDNTWERKQYQFMYSLAFVTDSRYHELFMKYDWVLRTDLDVFLTPNIMTFRPTQLVVAGQGGYSQLEVTRGLLRDVAKDLHLQHLGLHHLGSTWFIRPATMLAAGPVITRSARYLLKHEFANVNHKTKRGVIHKWPEWWRGVTSMYAAELGLNAVLRSENDLWQASEVLDVFTDLSRSYGEAIHLHTFHNDQRFSKFVFQQGGYTKEQFPAGSLDLGKAHDYATFVALYGVSE